MIDVASKSQRPPMIEIALDGRAGREILWQRAPLATGHSDVKQDVDVLAQIRAARTPQVARQGQKRLVMLNNSA